MTLFAVSLIGAIVSLLMMAAGFVWLGVRGELDVTRMDPAQAGDLAIRGARGRPGRTWFRGLAAGLSLSGEKSTREIIGLLTQRRWSDGLPWAIPALGALAAFFFWPLFIGILLGLAPVLLWGMVAFFVFGALYAAWPRRAR